MRILQLQAAVVVLALSSGCGSHSIGSCRSEELGICNDFTDGVPTYDVSTSDEDAITQARAGCQATQGGVWSPSPCDRTGALAGCHTFNAGELGTTIDSGAMWFWPGSSYYGDPPILAVKDVARVCYYGTLELPDGTFPPR